MTLIEVLKDARYIGPELCLLFFASFELLVGVFSEKNGEKRSPGYISLFGILVSMFLLLPLVGVKASVYYDAYFVDTYSLFFKFVFLLIGLITVLNSMDYVPKRGINYAEYYALILFSLIGMMVMTSARSLLMVFIGLETMSIPIYALCGVIQNDVRSIESSMKYFFLGSFATAFFLFGVSLVFGATGSFDLVRIREIILHGNVVGGRSILVLAGISLLVVGFGFKVASVPFHMWTPDVYEGAPTSITGYMATGVKAAAFGALLRVFMGGFSPLQGKWTGILWVLAFLTMSVGNITALVQRDVKRMLAYSSIAHAGYLLVGFTAGDTLGSSGILFYLLAYAFMSLGAFGVLGYIAEPDEGHDLDRFSGLAYRRPALALVMAVCMFSMAGIPPTAGFVGKFYLFSSAVKKGFIGLAILAVINSAISVYYYLRVVVYMYFKEPEGDGVPSDVSPSGSVALAISSFGVLFMGVFPRFIFEFAKASVRFLGIS